MMMMMLMCRSAEGGPKQNIYNGTHLANAHNVVVVSMQYRMNVFGFLALPQLQAENEYQSTGNYAMQDQRMALQWIQSNIASFGGDPGRVLMFGESAGGGEGGGVGRSHTTADNTQPQAPCATI